MMDHLQQLEMQVVSISLTQIMTLVSDDFISNSGSNNKFGFLINKAWNTLNDPSKTRLYDTGIVSADMELCIGETQNVENSNKKQ